MLPEKGESLTDWYNEIIIKINIYYTLILEVFMGYRISLGETTK